MSMMHHIILRTYYECELEVSSMCWGQKKFTGSSYTPVDLEIYDIIQATMPHEAQAGFAAFMSILG